MPRDAPHHIRSIAFQFDVSSRKQYHAFSDLVADLANNVLESGLQKVFDEVLEDPHQVLQIDRLEIDVGFIPQEDLRTELVPKIMEALRWALSERLAKTKMDQPSPAGVAWSADGPLSRMGTPYPPQPEGRSYGERAGIVQTRSEDSPDAIVSTARDKLQLILFFLRNGFFPEGRSEIIASLEEHFADDLDAEAAEYIRQTLAEPPAAGRALLHLPLPTLLALTQRARVPFSTTALPAWIRESRPEVPPPKNWKEAHAMVRLARKNETEFLERPRGEAPKEMQETKAPKRLDEQPLREAFPTPLAGPPGQEPAALSPDKDEQEPTSKNDLLAKDKKEIDDHNAPASEEAPRSKEVADKEKPAERSKKSIHPEAEVDDMAEREKESVEKSVSDPLPETHSPEHHSEEASDVLSREAEEEKQGEPFQETYQEAFRQAQEPHPEKPNDADELEVREQPVPDETDAPLSGDEQRTDAEGLKDSLEGPPTAKDDHPDTVEQAGPPTHQAHDTVLEESNIRDELERPKIEDAKDAGDPDLPKGEDQSEPDKQADPLKQSAQDRLPDQPRIPDEKKHPKQTSETRSSTEDTLDEETGPLDPNQQRPSADSLSKDRQDTSAEDKKDGPPPKPPTLHQDRASAETDEAKANQKPRPMDSGWLTPERDSFMLAGMPIFVDNAGLVLLWPFLSLLFEKLDLLADRSRFKSAEAAIKAVYVLEYACRKERAPAESRLVLNKILCGIPVREPISAPAPLSDETLATVEDMLEAVIAYWKVLKSTQPDGLRETFLQREGKLVLERIDWILYIEQQPFDMLLDDITWPLNAVHLPWMENQLKVNWR